MTMVLYFKGTELEDSDENDAEDISGESSLDDIPLDTEVLQAFDCVCAVGGSPNSHLLAIPICPQLESYPVLKLKY